MKEYACLPDCGRAETLIENGSKYPPCLPRPARKFSATEEEETVDYRLELES